MPGGHTRREVEENDGLVVSHIGKLSENCLKINNKILNFPQTEIYKGNLKFSIFVREQARGQLGRNSLSTDSNFSLFSVKGDVLM